MKTSEIRELSVAEIVERVEVEQTNFVTAKLNHAVSPIENTTLLKISRRNIARLLTILAEKQNQE